MNGLFYGPLAELYNHSGKAQPDFAASLSLAARSYFISSQGTTEGVRKTRCLIFDIVAQRIHQILLRIFYSADFTVSPALAATSYFISLWRKSEGK